MHLRANVKSARTAAVTWGLPVDRPSARLRNQERLGQGPWSRSEAGYPKPFASLMGRMGRSRPPVMRSSDCRNAELIAVWRAKSGLAGRSLRGRPATNCEVGLG